MATDMASTQSLLSAFKTLFDIGVNDLNQKDDLLFAVQVSRYIDAVCDIEAKEISPSDIDEDKTTFEGLIEDLCARVNRVADDEAKKHAGLAANGRRRDWSTDEELLDYHLELRKELAQRGILTGQPKYDSTIKFNPKGMAKFHWNYYPYDVPAGVYLSLKQPHTVFLKPPSGIHTYRRYHAFLYFEEACENYRMRRLDLSNVRLEVHNEESFILRHGKNLLIGDRLVLKSSKHEYFLGAFVHDKLDEGCLIKMDEQIHIEGIEGVEFDMIIVPDLTRVTSSRRHYAVSYMMQNSYFSDPILFPERRRSFERLPPPKIGIVDPSQIDDLGWFDKRLNEEQRNAVVDILRAEMRPAPFILMGPPGSGKLTTIIETVLQIYKQDPESKVLVCSQHADGELVNRILETEVIQNKHILRLVAAHRFKLDMTESEREISKLSNSVTEEMYSEYRLVITTCYQADRLRTYKAKFDYLFICNANMIDEPQCLISIRHLKPGGLLVLAGDPFAGEPACSSAIAKRFGFDISLMERLLCRSAYGKASQAAAADSRNQLFDGRYRAVLKTNYRCDARLMRPSIDFFYKSEMNCEVETPVWLLEAMTGCDNNRLFHHVDSMTSESFEKKERWNPSEIMVCLMYLKKLIAAGIKTDQIGIITPRSDQAKKMNLGISSTLDCDDIRVWKRGKPATEKEVLIISTVRSSPDEEDRFTAKEFNFAISRAKWMVILVGSREYLSKHPFGKEYLKWVHEISQQDSKT